MRHNWRAPAPTPATPLSRDGSELHLHLPSRRLRERERHLHERLRQLFQPPPNKTRLSFKSLRIIPFVHLYHHEGLSVQVRLNSFRPGCSHPSAFSHPTLARSALLAGLLCAISAPTTTPRFKSRHEIAAAQVFNCLLNAFLTTKLTIVLA